MDEQTPQTPAPTSAPAAARASGLRDRVLGWRGVTAVALASVILGGVGGAVLGTVSDGGDQSGMRGGPGGLGGPTRGMPAGVPGQLPPSTTPQQDGSDG